MEFLAPNVYIREANDTAGNIQGASTTVAGFVGICERGTINVPVYINSWTEFVDKFAYGLTSPFMLNSDLAYSVYGFFQNGGKRCYVVRTAHLTATAAEEVAAVATDDIGTGETKVVITALDAGTYGNKIKYKITANAVTAANMDIFIYSTLKGSEELVEKYENVVATAYGVVNAKSKYVRLSLGGTLVAVATVTALSGGLDGVTTIVDADFTASIATLELCQDLSMLAVPSQTSDTMFAIIKAYSESRKIKTFFDFPSGLTPAQVKTKRTTFSCNNGVAYYPWGKVSDPLATNGELRLVPTCGHLMGVEARTIAEKGVSKASAGIEASVRGFVGLETTLLPADIELLNPVGVNCIVSKPNYGIVVWGARSISPIAKFKYAPSISLFNYVYNSLYTGTQFAIFELNNETLWIKISAVVSSFLRELYKEGQIKSTFFVKCDAEVNSAEVQADGKTICQVGYQGVDTTEFMIFDISHSIGGNQ